MLTYAKEIIRRYRELFEIHWEVPQLEVPPVTLVNDDIYLASNVGASATNTTAGASTTIYSVPANKDFYLTGANLGFAAQGAFDGSIIYLQATVNGVAVRLCAGCKIATVAVNGNALFSPQKPLKVDAGTNIVMVDDGSAGLVTKSGSIQGYLRPGAQAF